MRPIIETARLTLRDWRLEDADDGFAIYGDPEVARFLGTGEPRRDVNAEREALTAHVAQNLRPERLRFGSWAMVERTSGRVRGTILLKPLPPTDAEIEIGWHLARAVWGLGYATEGAMAVLEYGFSTLELPRIHAVIRPDNERSARVACRLGMERIERTTRYYDGTELDLNVLERIRP